MRVISGSARSLPLKSVEGKNTRPTTDRIKETLFNMIAHLVAGCRFLDLFSGSGAIGIEALSRGAQEAVFVENHQKALACIRENLAFTRLADRARVLSKDVLAALRELEGEEAFTIIFLDPPYDQGYEEQVLRALRASTLVDEDTLLIVEASLNTDFSYLDELGYRLIREKCYKTNRHLFLEIQ